MNDLEWDPRNALAKAEAAARRKLEASAVVVQNRAKVLVSVAGTGQGRDAKGKFARIYNANPSAPGDPPHKQTGRLRASIAREVDGPAMVARVGTNVIYGRYLELGTRFMAPRPWLRRALAESWGDIRRIFGA